MRAGSALRGGLVLRLLGLGLRCAAVREPLLVERAHAREAVVNALGRQTAQARLLLGDRLVPTRNRGEGAVQLLLNVLQAGLGGIQRSPVNEGRVEIGQSVARPRKRLRRPTKRGQSAGCFETSEAWHDSAHQDAGQTARVPLYQVRGHAKPLRFRCVRKPQRVDQCLICDAGVRRNAQQRGGHSRWAVGERFNGHGLTFVIETDSERARELRGWPFFIQFWTVSAVPA